MSKKLINKFSNHQTRSILRLELCLGVGFILIFAAIAVAHYSLTDLDRQIENWFSTSTTPTGHYIFNKITWLGQTIILVPITFAIIFWQALQKQWFMAIGLFISVILGGFLTFFFKLLFHTQHPGVSSFSFQYMDLGFPSGHAMISLLFFGFLGYTTLRNSKNFHQQMIIGACTALIILSVGLSRLFLGVHFPTDVLGGWSLGAAWLMISIIMIELIEKRRYFLHKKNYEKPENTIKYVEKPGHDETSSII